MPNDKSAIVKIDHGVLIPGNGCGDYLGDCMWYPWIAQRLTKCGVLTVSAANITNADGVTCGANTTVVNAKAKTENEKRTDESSADETSDSKDENTSSSKRSDNDDDGKSVSSRRSSSASSSSSSSKDKKHIRMHLSGFPFHLEAYENEWKEFAIDSLGLSETSILIGHSSGAACSLRLMEERPIAACVLVSAYNSDMGDELERESGYFNRPFGYDKMVANCPFIFQFHAKDDHLVPLAIAREVSQGLRKASEAYNNNPTNNHRKSTYVYVETASDGHFQDDDYEEVMWTAIRKVLPFSEERR